MGQVRAEHPPSLYGLSPERICMRIDFNRILNRRFFYLIVLFLLVSIIVIPAHVVFADGCGGTSSTGGGFNCGAGSSIPGNTGTGSTGGSSGGGGGGGSGHHGGSGSSTGGPPAGTCGWVIEHGGECLGLIWQGGGHHHGGGGGGGTTFTICNNVIVTDANIGCDTQWKLTAHVDYPGIPIDTRPYPATLNRWPTVLRVGALETSSGSAGLGYIPAGGGSPTNPSVGDWRNIKLTLTLYPKTAIPPQVYLENIGWVTTPVGQFYTFQWPLPSHPAAGGGPTAGAVGQLQELAQDTPLYTNYARAAYGLTCELDWQQYTKNCVLGPDSSGNYDCGGDRGHTVYSWDPHSVVHDIPPTEVKNLPPAQAADTNGDGVPDSYWDLGVVIRRMNDANSISDPVYAHSYSWGSVFYWAAREAQGEITYP